MKSLHSFAHKMRKCLVRPLSVGTGTLARNLLVEVGFIITMKSIRCVDPIIADDQ